MTMIWNRFRHKDGLSRRGDVHYKGLHNGNPCIIKTVALYPDGPTWRRSETSLCQRHAIISTMYDTGDTSGDKVGIMTIIWFKLKYPYLHFHACRIMCAKNISHTSILLKQKLIQPRMKIIHSKYDLNIAWYSLIRIWLVSKYWSELSYSSYCCQWNCLVGGFIT